MAKTLSSKTVQQALLRKGFELNNRDHAVLVLHYEGLPTPIHTKISHGANHDIDQYLIGKMARQLKLPKDLFFQLINCTLGYDGYIEYLQVNNTGLLKSK